MLKVELKVVGGTHAGKVIPLAKQRFLIGRGEDCQLRPASDQISRNHCAFSVDDFTVRLRDLGSTNGTHVNGKRIHGEVILKDSDRVRIGSLEFDLRISHEQVSSSQTTEPGAMAAVLASGVAPDTGEILSSDTVLDMAAAPAETQNGLETVAGDSTVILPEQPQSSPQSQAEQFQPPNQPAVPAGQPYPVQPVPVQPVPYPQAAYPYQQPMYPQQPYPQQPFPQQAYAYPGYMPMQAQPAPYPPQQPVAAPQPQPVVAPAPEEPATTDEEETPELPVKLPSPESTGAEPPAVQASESGEGESSPEKEVNPSTSAADAIKSMKFRRPGI